MQHGTRKWLRFLQQLAPLLILILTIVPTTRGTVYQQELPDGEGKELFVNKCGQCHGLDYATTNRRTRSGWDGIIREMVEMGAVLSEEDKTAIVGYLSKAFGKINVNTAPADQIESFLGLSSNDAKAIVSYRTEHGEFKTVDDLKQVPGIDVKVLEEKKGWIAF
jgi:competence protein ComEA